MMKPPPVRKSHGIPQAFTATGVNINTAVATATTSPPATSANPSLPIILALWFIVFPPFASRPLYAALRNTRCRRRNHHVGNAIDDDVKGVDGDAAWGD